MTAGPFTPRQATPADDGTTCGICQTAVRPGEAVGGCPSCGALLHAECWAENGGCATYGCALTPEQIHETVPDAAGAIWGMTEKRCPACGQTVRAAAARCRHCGATLPGPGDLAPGPRQTAGPGRPVLLALLAASVVPFTSPLVFCIGGPWLLARRGALLGWPAAARAMAVMAVVAAGAVTLVTAAAIVIQLHLGADGAH